MNDYFHKRTMNSLDRLTHENGPWLKRAPRLMGTNLLASIACIAELAKITLETLALASTYNFAKKTMTTPIDWNKTVTKTVAISGAIILSGIAIVGSLISDKPSRWNVDFQANHHLFKKTKKVTFVLGDREFAIKRHLVVEHSQYLKTLLDGQYKEGYSPVISLKEIDPDAFQSFIDFVKNESKPS